MSRARKAGSTKVIKGRKCVWTGGYWRFADLPPEACRACGEPIMSAELCARCAAGNDPFKTAENCGADLRR